MNKNKLNQNLFSIITFSFLLTFTNCGSFEGVSYYATDGIYNTEDSIKNQQNRTESNSSTDQSSTYYENYFKNFSNDSQNQTDQTPNSVNENNNVYIVDNSPNIRMRYGFSSFDYWNNWAFNGFGFPYNNFSNNGLFWPHYSPYWNYGYQGMYFNNGWGNGYSLYGWNNYNPYNYVVSNQNQYGRKIPYNRGSVNQRSYDRLSRNLNSNSRVNQSTEMPRNNTRTNIGRKIRKVLGDFSPQNQSYLKTNRGNSNSNRSNFSQNNSRSNNNSRSSQNTVRAPSRSSSSVSSGRSKSGRNN